MQRILLCFLIIFISAKFGTAQTVAFQGFDGSGLNNWTFTAFPVKYNLPASEDVWSDTTYLGNNGSGNVAVSAAAQGSRFWGMWDLENPYTTGTLALPSPYYHYLTFATRTLNPAVTYTVKFKYFTNIVGGSGDSLGYIVEYNNGSTWNMTNYTLLTGATQQWDSAVVTVPANSQYVRLRILARINGGNDYAAVDAVELTTAAPAPSVKLLTDLYITDEAVDTFKVPVVVNNKHASLNTTVDFSLVSGFNTANASDITLLTNMLTFTPSSADTQYAMIKVNNDAIAEPAEYFAVAISNVTNGDLNSANKATVYIKDNDYKASVARKNIELQHLGSYFLPTAGASAEIVAFDSASKRLYVVNSLQNELHILNFSNPAILAKIDSIDMSSYGGGINSVAVHNGIVAVAVEANPKTDSGSIVFLDKDGAFLKSVKAGFLPDMVCFTPDGKYVLTANEGEPNTAYTIDPEGSITIVDIQNGVTNATVKHVTFTAFNGMESSLRSLGIRIYGYNNASVAKDLEPEYITVNKTSDTAWVTLQENNAIAVIHIPTNNLLDIMPLGYADHMNPNYAIDGSDQSPEVLIANWPVRGMYLPDALGNYQVNGKTYLVLANEGDAREYDPYEEESRISSNSNYKLDPTRFPNADLLKKNFNIGRLNAVTSMGDIDNDGDFDEIYVLGSRSFTIVDATNANVMFNSGGQFEQIILADPKVGKIFNASNDGNSPKNRSDNKGPEPEGVAIGTIRDTVYAFIGLERIGGVMVYDITNPLAPAFVDYINTRDTASFGGDNGTEGIIFFEHGGKYYVITANETSGSVAVFEVKVAPVGINDIKNQLPALNVYPNPVHDGKLYFSETISGVLVDMQGRAVAQFSNANNIPTSGIAPGTYILHAEGYAIQKVVVQ